MLKSAVTAALLAGLAVPLAAQTPAAPGPAPAPAARQKLPDDSLAIARKYAGWVWSLQIDSIQAHSPPESRTAQNRQEFLDNMGQLFARIGAEDSLVEERWVRRNGARQYWRVVRMSLFRDEPGVLRIVIMPDGSWGGMGINPLSRVPPIDPEP